MKREPKSSLELELLSVRDIVRALKRLDYDTDRTRVLNAAMAFVRGTRAADVQVRLSQGCGVTWEEPS